jgi:CHAT domain-containing protein
MFRLLVPALALLCGLAACTTPPPEAYVGGQPPTTGAASVGLGPNAAGESCNQLPAGPGSVAIYCGEWREPAARVRILAGASDQEALLRQASGSEWRSGLDLRFACAAPVPTAIPGGQPAVLLSCTRKVGGWPQVALAASAGGRTYLADGITPALPVIERAIGVLSGQITADAPALPRSAADALLANQLAAHAFSAGDVSQYEQAMALGQRTNLAEDFATSETAYRAALAMQQKALGQDNPDAVNAMMHLALQLSNQGRFPEADALFRRADALAPRAADRVAAARLLHYRALHALNQHNDTQALALLERADAAYAALLPSDLSAAGAGARARAVSADTAGLLPDTSLLVDPTMHSALMGLIETRRYRAILLRDSGRVAESTETMAAVQQVASATGMTVPLISARLSRTDGTVASGAGASLTATNRLAESAADFAVVLPQTRPLAKTALLQAGEYVRAGDTARAVGLCETGSAMLRSLRAGTGAALVQPCLVALAAEAERRPADRQSLRGEMFEIAQLSQGSLTSRQIEEAAARLAGNARNPKVGDAIRRRQDAADTLAELYRTRDLLARGPVPGAPPAAGADAADLDHRIATAQADLADADGALQAAAPNYGQLVQEVAPTADVLAALRPQEVFVAIVLMPGGGWIFALRDGQVDAAPVHGDAAAVAALVQRLRAGIEPTASAPPRFDTEAAQDLYQAVLAPVAARLEGARALVVAPSGPLLSVPFSVLLTGKADPGNLAGAPWLIRQLTVAHVPAAANFVALRRIAGGSRAAHPWFGFGDARPVTLAQAERSFPRASCANSASLFAALQPLQLAARELDGARQVLNASPADEMLGDAFTAPAVLRASLKDYRILHFASHALLPTDLRCQTEPAIVTSAPKGAPDASGALLTAGAVVGMDLDANAVILSACNTGGPGGGAAGESLSGLARAFFYAGARALLVTHWSINDKVSAYLVVSTLRRVAAAPADGLAAALADAQRAMLDGAGRTMPAEIAQPYYWAPFALIGEGGPQQASLAVAGR